MPLTILDVGGCESFCVNTGLVNRARTTVLNLVAPPAPRTGITTVAGDARDLSRYEDGSFDIVVAHCLIEHAGTLSDQRRIASEVRRVGRDYFIHIPGFWFPLEPHSGFPGFHWLPAAVRCGLLRWFTVGRIERQPSLADARAAVRSTRLVRPAELESMFPDAEIWREKSFGLTKSLVMYRVAGSEPRWERRLQAALALG